MSAANGSVGKVANWILDLLFNDSTTVENQTVLAWDIDADTVDGMTLFVLDDDTAGLPGAVWDSVAKVWSYRRADGELVAKLLSPTPITESGAVQTLDPLAMIPWEADFDLPYDGYVAKLMTDESLPVWVRYGDAQGTELNPASLGVAGDAFIARGTQTQISGREWELETTAPLGTNGVATATSDGLLTPDTPYLVVVDVTAFSVTDVLQIINFFPSSGQNSGVGSVFLSVTGVGQFSGYVTPTGAQDTITILAQGGVATMGDNLTYTVSIKEVLRTDSTQPSISITQIGDNIPVADNTSSFTVQSLQTAEGLYSSLALTNKVTAVKANPASGVTTNITKAGDAASTLGTVQDVAALVTAGLDVICSTGEVYDFDNTAGIAAALYTVEGVSGNTNTHAGEIYARVVSGSVTATLGWSATGLGEFGSFTAATYSLVSGTATPTSAGDKLLVVVPAGGRVFAILPGLYESPIAPPSPIIGDDTAAAQTMTPTVTTTPIADTKLDADGSFILITANPDRAGQTGSLVSTYTDASNSTDVLINATDITLRKRIATVDNDAVISYTHAADTPFAVIAIWDGTNMRVTAAKVGGTFPAYDTDSNVASAVLGSTLESFSRNGGEQFQGEGVMVSSFSTEAQLISFVDKHNIADTSNL
jgi:hypothetical protein